MTKNAKKKATNQKRSTLDQKHTDKLKHFEKRIESLPQKKKKLKKLELELSELTNTRPNKHTPTDIHRKACILDQIKAIRTDILHIENHTDSLNYIVDVLPILIDYYDNDQIIDDGMEEDLMSSNTGAKRNILTYLAMEANSQSKDLIESPVMSKKKTNRSKSNKKTTRTTTKTTTKVTTRTTTKTTTKTMAKPTVPPPQRVSRAKLYENYRSITDPSFKDPSRKRNNKCADVDCPGEKIVCQNGCLACNVCGASESTLSAIEKPNYKEPVQDSGIYAYKRINHLTEILSQLQAKESTDIPAKIFESILREIKKRKIDKYDLDIFRLRRILKKLNFIKYYEHVPHILQIINGKEPPNFSREDEARIKKMFKDIQKPFAIYCPKNRKNFLNYSYVLHKFCELLDLDSYITYFPLLKNNSKLLQHDRIWKNICGYMSWKYYKSI